MKKTSGRFRWSLLIRAVVFLLILTGSGFAIREFRRTQAAEDLPMATARKGEFLVLVRSRGSLMARRSEQLVAPLDVADLQIVWAAPDGSEVTKGQVVMRFDPSRTQQDLNEKKAALQQAQATLDQAVSQALITEDQDKLDLDTARYNVEKAKLEASKQTIISEMQGEESEIDLSLAEEKLKVQEAAMLTHRKAGEQKIAALTRGRDTAKRLVEFMDVSAQTDGA